MFKTSCPAKLNLFLKLTGKRVDGYHELESLFVLTDLADELSVEKNSEFKIEISGEFAQFVDPQNNLFTKILDFFAAKFAISKNLKIKITKNIPVGAGLGGGSSDAASFIKILNDIFALNLAKNELQKISLNFGSDIAFFFEEQAAIVKGRGEIIENFPQFAPLDAILIHPQIHLSTKEIFTKFAGKFSTEIPTSDLLKTDIFELANLPNDLEKPAITTAPIISEIIATLKNSGAEIAKMSGSGSSCFGIFVEGIDAAEKNLREKFPEFFVRKIKIISRYSSA